MWRKATTNGVSENMLDDSFRVCGARFPGSALTVSGRSGRTGAGALSGGGFSVPARGVLAGFRERGLPVDLCVFAMGASHLFLECRERSLERRRIIAGVARVLALHVEFQFQPPARCVRLPSIWTVLCQTTRFAMRRSSVPFATGTCNAAPERSSVPRGIPGRMESPCRQG